MTKSKTSLRSPLVTPMVTFLKSVSTSGDETRAENLALQAEVKGLRELVDLYRERFTDADWRYQELMEQFKTMTKALPMAPEELPVRNAGGGPSDEPWTLQLATKQATAGQGGRTGNFLRIRLTERNPAPETKRNPRIGM